MSSGSDGSRSGSGFIKIDAGLFIPTPKDQKRCVSLMVGGLPAPQKLLVNFGSVVDAVAWVQACLAEDADWFELINAVYGEPVMVSRDFVEGITSIGYEWVDMEEIRSQQEQRRLAARGVEVTRR